MHEEMDKVVFSRGLGAGEWDLGTLPAKRVAALARWAKTASNQALAQSAPERRYTALLALGAERLVEVTDQPLGIVGLERRQRVAGSRRNVSAEQLGPLGVVHPAVPGHVGAVLGQLDERRHLVQHGVRVRQGCSGERSSSSMRSRSWAFPRQYRVHKILRRRASSSGAIAV